MHGHFGKRSAWFVEVCKEVRQVWIFRVFTKVQHLSWQIYFFHLALVRKEITPSMPSLLSMKTSLSLTQWRTLFLASWSIEKYLLTSHTIPQQSLWICHDDDPHLGDLPEFFPISVSVSTVTKIRVHARLIYTGWWFAAGQLRILGLLPAHVNEFMYHRGHFFACPRAVVIHYFSTVFSVVWDL